MSCEHYNHILTEDERHFILSKEHNNCVNCLSEDKGPMTQEQVGKYLSLTKMRISQIERKALEKLRKRKYLFE